MADLYITNVASVKLYMGLTGSTYDALLAVLVQNADAMIRTYCNRPLGFIRAEQSETLSGTGGGFIIPTYTPFDLDEDFTVTLNGTLLDSNAYAIDPNTGIVGFATSVGYGWGDMWAPVGSQQPRGRHRFPQFSEGYRNVVVAYTGGWYALDATPPVGSDVPIVPADLQQACIEVVKLLFNARDVNGILKHERLGEYDYENFQISPLSAAFRAVCEQWLSNYVRRPCLAMGL